MRWVACVVLAGMLAGCIQVEVGGPSSPSASTETASSQAATPRLSFTTDPTQPKAGQVVTFTFSATGLSSGDRISSTSWTFGDGTGSSDRQPLHVFRQPGSFAVKVIATTAKGAEASHQSMLRIADASSTSSPSPSPAPAPASTPTNSTSENETESRPFEPTEPSGTCGSFGSFEPVAPNPVLAPGLALGWPLLRLDIALLADPAFVAAHPDDWRALLVDLVDDASVHYEAQVGLRLNASLVDRLPDGSLAPGSGDGQQRAVGRGFMKANHPDADVDAVGVILGANYEGAVAGQVECVHGAGYPDYSYLWAEYDDERESPAGIGVFEDLPLKIFMHELAHLLAAHHHYSTCLHPYAQLRTSDLTGVCDVMINDIGLASFYFGPTNRLVMRSYVEELGIGTPVT